MSDPISEFRKAVESDEYAELELPKGDVLITDYEGDMAFYPYVMPKDKDCGDRSDEIANQIINKLSVRVDRVEYSDNNNCYFPVMERP